jgi:hypothetical protein
MSVDEGFEDSGQGVGLPEATNFSFGAGGHGVGPSSTNPQAPTNARASTVMSNLPAKESFICFLLESDPGSLRPHNRDDLTPPPRNLKRTLAQRIYKEADLRSGCGHVWNWNKNTPFRIDFSLAHYSLFLQLNATRNSGSRLAHLRDRAAHRNYCPVLMLEARQVGRIGSRFEGIVARNILMSDAANPEQLTIFQRLDKGALFRPGGLWRRLRMKGTEKYESKIEAFHTRAVQIGIP